MLFLPELPPEVDEVLGLEPDFIAALDGQGDERGCWVHDGFQMLSVLSDAPTLPAGVDVKQPQSTALTMRIWCCTPSGMMN